jgi:hypothetical protein
MDRFRFDDNRLKPDAFIAYLVGVVAAYVIQARLRFGGGGILTTIIVVAVGGLWYHWRKIL